jgi:hypothetical protein
MSLDNLLWISEERLSSVTIFVYDKQKNCIFNFSTSDDLVRIRHVRYSILHLPSLCTNKLMTFMDGRVILQF